MVRNPSHAARRRCQRYRAHQVGDHRNDDRHGGRAIRGAGDILDGCGCGRRCRRARRGPDRGAYGDQTTHRPHAHPRCRQSRSPPRLARRRFRSTGRGRRRFGSPPDPGLQRRPHRRQVRLDRPRSCHLRRGGRWCGRWCIRRRHRRSRRHRRLHRGQTRRKGRRRHRHRTGRRHLCSSRGRRSRCRLPRPGIQPRPRCRHLHQCRCRRCPDRPRIGFLAGSGAHGPRPRHRCPCRHLPRRHQPTRLDYRGSRRHRARCHRRTLDVRSRQRLPVDVGTSRQQRPGSRRRSGNIGTRRRRSRPDCPSRHRRTRDIRTSRHRCFRTCHKYRSRRYRRARGPSLHQPGLQRLHTFRWGRPLSRAEHQ